jgi:hypothetical protein
MNNNDKFVGYYIIGTNTQEEAISGAGLMLWMQTKPSWFKRTINLFFLGIRWVNKADKIEGLLTNTTKTEMPKRSNYGKPEKKRNTGTRDTGPR